MISLKQAIIVEGRYDIARVRALFDAPVFETNGFSVFHDKKTMELFRRLAQTRGIIILTDPDSAGMQIRNKIKGSVTGEVYHAYIPDIYGKERRKASPSKEGKLGVEGVPDEVIVKAVMDSGAQRAERPSGSITKALLYELGLSGQKGSSEKRQQLKKKLGLPEQMGPGAFLQCLNALLTEERLREMIENL